nr:immunoglobulin heavy chain junction region [Macaca mulatta]MOX15786.1 immunoglobulin heavy chain junction region [Macaca mulatta]MOX15800.1 immunoglobulin heavy chain junction region [Macaca mulatta]MOX15918.1 immunoglobulin heavy chain junction region [Macaca mulatta]MOX15928.1 immunoglobulin heavy chain junction region [Macaca mulatta]
CTVLVVMPNDYGPNSW